ncbi:MAG: DUF4112 domain-containing protein [Candidatus Competibacteraceae bacterium]|jgi:hypothetical protein|nr:DUF4112 domain-containing protein [Candidatus Competibacteraceae bacterium]
MTRQQTITKSHESAKDRLNHLAWFLDNSIPVPGLGGYRIGADGLIGLIPGIGDALGAVAASYILGEAARLGVPKSVLLQMFFNIAIDSIVGLIPFAGDLFDMAWKANIRNVRLIERYVDAPGRTTRSSRFLAFGLITTVLLFLGFIFLLGLLVLKWFVGLLIA